MAPSCSHSFSPSKDTLWTESSPRLLLLLIIVHEKTVSALKKIKIQYLVPTDFYPLFPQDGEYWEGLGVEVQDCPIVSAAPSLALPTHTHHFWTGTVCKLERLRCPCKTCDSLGRSDRFGLFWERLCSRGVRWPEKKLHKGGKKLMRTREGTSDWGLRTWRRK